MITRRNLLVTAACVCTGLALVRVHAAEPSVRSFVEAIYASYAGKNSKGVSLDSDAAIRRYFEPSLAALIIKDRREARGEVGKLGSDPFIDAQDWEIDNVDVVTPAPTRRARLFHSKTSASSRPLSLLWSSSKRDGASPTSRGTATERCAAF